MYCSQLVLSPYNETSKGNCVLGFINECLNNWSNSKYYHMVYHWTLHILIKTEGKVNLQIIAIKCIHVTLASYSKMKEIYKKGKEKKDLGFSKSVQFATDLFNNEYKEKCIWCEKISYMQFSDMKPLLPFDVTITKMFCQQ